MPETIGQRLKNIRISRQLSLEKAAEATRVRTHYLQALESDNYSVMASAAQGRGFLRLYADYLNLDLEAAMDEMRAAEEIPTMQTDVTPAPAPESSPKGEPVSQTPPASLADGKPGRRGFWSRILRRPVPEPPVETEFAPEAGTPFDESPVPAPTLAAEPAPAPVRVKKTPTPVKSDKPKSKPKTAAQATGKKKQPLNIKPKR